MNTIGTSIFFADFHIHSKFSRSTSKDLNLEELTPWAKIKGISLLGTGDFTHPQWLSEIKSKTTLSKNGLLEKDGVHFILTSEVCNIFLAKRGKNKDSIRRVHNIIFAPDIFAVEKINQFFSRVGNLISDGRPVLGLDAEYMVKVLRKIDKRCFVVPSHIWTPWFGILGSFSGFDSVEECFGDMTQFIYAVETGLSSDPPMNWLCSMIDRFSIISNSDAHSVERIGREATAFRCDIGYEQIMDTLKNRDIERFPLTIEFYPQEGKYYYDGHRNCSIGFAPEESVKHNNTCPVCGRHLTIGVLHRVKTLADRPQGFLSSNRSQVRYCVPLVEIISDVVGMSKKSKQVQVTYFDIIKRLGNEIEILLFLDEERIRKNVAKNIADAIIRVRNNAVDVQPGYDGKYGKVKIVLAKGKIQKRIF